MTSALRYEEWAEEILSAYTAADEIVVKWSGIDG